MPIGKKKTALIDANRKTNFTKISFQRNSTIKRFGFPNNSTDCILRIWCLTFFRLRPFRIKCEQHYSSVNTFLFRTHFFRNWDHFLFSHVIKADWTFVIWTQRESTQRRKSRPTTRSYSDVKLRKAHQVTTK